MEGIVTSFLESTIRLTLIGVNNTEAEIDAVIDTGFNGHLTLPLDLLSSLGWPLKQEVNVEMGDASITTMNIYRGIVVWSGNPRLVAVAEAESTPYVGTAMLSGSELKIEFKPGGKIFISPLC